MTSNAMKPTTHIERGPSNIGRWRAAKLQERLNGDPVLDLRGRRTSIDTTTTATTTTLATLLLDLDLLTAKRRPCALATELSGCQPATKERYPDPTCTRGE